MKQTQKERLNIQKRTQRERDNGTLDVPQTQREMQRMKTNKKRERMIQRTKQTQRDR